MKIKISVLLFLGLFLTTWSLEAQQYTRIGVVDLSRIYTQYFRESAPIRELEEMRQRFQQEINRINEEIRQLQERKITAMNDGDDVRALELDNQIFQRQEYLREFSRVRQNQLNARREALNQDTSFLSQILGAVTAEAEAQGFSMVYRMDDPNLVYYNREVDITDSVINRLTSRR